MPETSHEESCVALLGWSLHAINAMKESNRRYLVVGGGWAEEYAQQNDIPFIKWEFERINEHSGELFDALKEAGVRVCVPIYEETVEWAGAINSRLLGNPRLLNQAMLFRDKAMMKRRAQMSGIRVGVFEVADDQRDVSRFLKRVNDALLKLDVEANDPIHVKPFDRSGTYGHRVVNSEEEAESIPGEDFPLLMESHLDGREFACEVFIQNRKIRFLNISEYVHLGYSVFVPASPELEQYRALVTREIEKLIDAFDIEDGVIHPEYFITQDEQIHFGEVAFRVPGGNAFELIARAYDFNPYLGQVVCMDPDTTEEEISSFFPREVVDAKGYAGTFLVFPKVKVVTGRQVPDEVRNDPYFEKDELYMPVDPEVADREAFGNHYGSLFFFGDDPNRMRQLLLDMEALDFYS